MTAVLVFLGFWSASAGAQNYRPPKEFFNISPQIGGTTAPSGDVFAGIAAAKYYRFSENAYLGGGAGVYLQGREAVGEVLLKYGLVGVLGASVGPSFSESGGVSLTNDLWANAIFAGVRWRMDHREEGTIHSVALFVPLGLWIEEMR